VKESKQQNITVMDNNKVDFIVVSSLAIILRWVFSTKKKAKANQ